MIAKQSLRIARLAGLSGNPRALVKHVMNHMRPVASCPVIGIRGHDVFAVLPVDKDRQ